MNREIYETEEGETLEPPEPVVLTLPSSPEYIVLARLLASRIGQLAGFSDEDVYDLKLAVTEAATNVVRHAAVESFDVEYRMVSGTVYVTVTDFGGGLATERLTKLPDGQGGFGLSVIRSLVDEVALDAPPGGGTRLRMVRRGASPGRGEREASAR